MDGGLKKVNEKNIFPPGTNEALENVNNMSSDSSVSGLLSHNRDLGARLNVALSKNIDLENLIRKYKKSYASYEAQFQKAREQIALQKEKFKYVENENNGLKQKLQKSQAFLADQAKAVAEAKDKLRYETHENRTVKEEYKKLKSLVSNEYLPERDFLRQALTEKNSIIETIDLEKKSLVNELENINKQTADKINQALNDVETLKSKFSIERDTIITNFSAKKEVLTQEIDSLKSENIVLEDRNKQLRKEQIEKTELLNRIEEIKQEKELNLYEFKEEKDNLLIQVDRMKSELDRAKIENHDLKKQWSKTQAEFRKFKHDQSNQSEQIMSLQSMWNEKNQEINRIKIKNAKNEVRNEELTNKVLKVSKMTQEMKSRLQFFFGQLDAIKEKQDPQSRENTEALENVFKKAIEPLTDFDYNLKL